MNVVTANAMRQKVKRTSGGFVATYPLMLENGDVITIIANKSESVTKQRDITSIGWRFFEGGYHFLESAAAADDLARSRFAPPEYSLDT